LLRSPTDDAAGTMTPAYSVDFMVRAKTMAAVYRLFRNKPFEPEAISVMTGAYADICRALGLGDYERERADTDDVAKDVVARKVIEFAQRGVSDRVRLREQVLQDLRA
jgi:hypothetical protein